MTTQRIRTVIMTDGEVDDMNSFIRYLLYSNEVETQGIILTSSMFHYAGNDQKPPYRWTGEQWIPDSITAYAEIYENLKFHDTRYPSPESLQSVYRVGNITDVGEMDSITPGSQLLEQLLLDDDPRPLYIQSWGGLITLARALRSIQECFEHTSQWTQIRNRIEEKVIIYTIFYQDNTYTQYIEPNWHLTVLFDELLFGYFAYGWRQLPSKYKQYLSSSWFTQHVCNKNALLDRYTLIGDGTIVHGERDEDQFGTMEYLQSHPECEQYEFISEGDSLTYLYLIHPELLSCNDPTVGGWSGRFREIRPKFYTSTALDYNPLHSQFEQEFNFYRWLPAI